MSNTIDQINLKNSFYNSICPWKEKSKDQITKADKEHLFPPKRKGWEHSFAAEDIFENPTEEDKKLFHKNWVTEIVADKTGKKSNEIYTALIEKGFTKEQSDLIIHTSIQTGFRSKDWADFNETNGKVASHLMDTTIALGIASKVLDSDSVPKVVRTVCNVAHGVALGARSYYQGSMYNRPDDDAAKNRFEAEMYGDKISGCLANVATTIDTKIRPWAQPLAELLPEKYKGPVAQLLPLATPAWFRARMAAGINHEFLTDLFKLLIHKPLSFFGNKKSNEVLSGIKERRNLEWSYFMERHYKNAGLTDKKDQTPSKLISQVFKLLGNILSNNKNTKVKNDSTTKLSNVIAPTFGIWGLFAVTVGGITSSLLKIFDKQNRFINFLFSSGITSQQLIYLFRLVSPLKIEAEELHNQLQDRELTKTWSKEQVESRKDLYKKKTNLYRLGLTCFLVNALNTFLKLKTIENPYLQKAINILDEVAGDLINKFFSHRRYLKGYEFRTENPKYFEEGNDQSPESTQEQTNEKKELELTGKR